MARFHCPLNNCNVEHEGSFELIVPMSQMHIISSHKKNVSQDDVFTLIANQAKGDPTLPLSMRDPEPVVEVAPTIPDPPVVVPEIVIPEAAQLIVETPVVVEPVVEAVVTPIVEPEMNPPEIVVATVANETPTVSESTSVSTVPSVVIEPQTPEVVVETPKEVKVDQDAKIADWWKKMKK
jgi:hypothetical protein